MRFVHIIVALMAVSAASGCSSGAERAQKRAYEAQEAVAKERLRLVDQYQDCVDEAGAHRERRRGCETYLRSADALN